MARLLRVLMLVALGLSAGCQGSLTVAPLPTASMATLALAADPPPEQKQAQIEGPWGDLRGRFVYDGEPPKRAEINTGGKDGIQAILDETLLVDAPTRGVANVVIYVRTRDLKIHPDLAQAPKLVQLTARGARFEPHILLARVGQELAFPSTDPFGHNATYQQPGDERFGVLLRGQGETEKIARADLIPVPVGCNIHPWMRAYVLARPNPYAAVSGQDGSFRIPLLPAGELEFQIWHERSGFLAGKPEWKQGRFALRIEAGRVNDLGVIKLDPALLKR